MAVVPDVVGMNHQLAQDTLQASGFYLLHEEDATGQGRMLIYDRNWEVELVPAGSGVPLTLSSRDRRVSQKSGLAAGDPPHRDHRRCPGAAGWPAPLPR